MSAAVERGEQAAAGEGWDYHSGACRSVEFGEDGNPASASEWQVHEPRLTNRRTGEEHPVVRRLREAPPGRRWKLVAAYHNRPADGGPAWVEVTFAGDSPARRGRREGPGSEVVSLGGHLPGSPREACEGERTFRGASLAEAMEAAAAELLG